MSDPALLDIVRHYTREAGVRNLEREIAKIGRKAVKQLLLDDKEQKPIHVTPRNIEKYLGVKRFAMARPRTATASVRSRVSPGRKWVVSS